jgi:putative ABC transport system permease protein
MQFTVSAIVRQNGVAHGGVNNGVIADINDVQEFLELPDHAEMLVALVDPALYETNTAEQAALDVRDVAINVQSALGDQYSVRMDKAQALDRSSETFLVIQALINTYGLMTLAVVGLLIYTLVMTNVQEQRREMAILRIVGSPRKTLFGIVIAEVSIIGVVGVTLGILLGQALTIFAVVPLIEYLVRQEGQALTLQPAVSLTSILPVVGSAIVVLVLSALKPAQDAAKTKVINAINPGVADNIQLEDLDKLREQRPTMRLFIIGLGMLFVVLMVAGFAVAASLDNQVALAAILLGILTFMVVGIAFIFFVFTRPLERLILFLTSLISPKLTYFARRNVGRSTERNTLISLLVLVSGALPSFLATWSALNNASFETGLRLNMGAPVEIQSFSRYDESELAALSRLRPSFVSNELLNVPGVGTAVGMTYEYFTQVSDSVGMRSGWLNLVGVTGDLSDVLYKDLIEFTLGGHTALKRILDDPTAVIISQGMADGLVVPLGGTIKVHGEGLDHVEELTIAGIARRLPGFSNVGTIPNQALGGGTVFISVDGFHRMTTLPQEAPADKDDPILDRVLATLSPNADSATVQTSLHETFGRQYDIWTQLADVQIESARESRVLEGALLLTLTLISFVTAVFGVFAVIYVTIYARRKEIGMMKAVGARIGELNGILSVESIAMTLSAALAGIFAGSTIGYVVGFAFSVAQQRPQQFVVDTLVTPFIVIVVTLAAILGTVLSSRRIIRRKAVEILRMS